MKLVCISDTHNHPLTKEELPPGDVLIHSGDATGRGLPHELIKFFQWSHKLDYKYKLFVPGNHDFAWEKDEKYAREIVSNWTTLIGQSVIIDGVKFYGHPWQPRFYDWAFNVDRNSARMQRYIDNIPDDVEVLISHGPPFGILDFTSHNERMGCEQLRERIKQLKKLKVCTFGHNHKGAGVAYRDGVTFINASIMNESYIPVNKPVVVEI